jgi:hypothetical protein
MRNHLVVDAATFLQIAIIPRSHPIPRSVGFRTSTRRIGPNMLIKAGAHVDMTERRITVQLKDYLRQLRSFRPSTEGIVAAVNSVPLRDISRVGLRRFGPFESHDAFYQFLRANYPLDTFPIVEGSAEVIAAHSPSYASGFTHGDVAPRNIFLKNDRTVTGIVHWKYSGWYRTESIRKQTIPYAPDDWVSSIGEITGAFEEQLAGERQLYSLCGYMLT